jgi:predicted glycoside hydrolase/deacetylase ChbG (UPF0249 family)
MVLNSKRSTSTVGQGALIVNADDWGRDEQTTDRTIDCILGGAVSSVSAMVFMEDSERAAEIARKDEIDAGLHLNLTTPFSMPGSPARLKEHQGRLSSYLRPSRFASVVYHPGLANSFHYVVRAQLDEFQRLYGANANRIDGHHHMHLCTNVLLGRLLPEGTLVRRNFTFAAGEKSFGNRLYRKSVDGLLARRHYLTDLFFSLPPMEPRQRLQRIFAASQDFIVELETHPVNPAEHRFLAGGEIFQWTEPSSIHSFRSLRPAVPAA